ncbi:MAG: porin [Gammaproteobacteria bacterium]|nr:porin [Gammaproteobacteria bacterium]
MKKPLIAVAVSMALAATAQAESQFYGKMNVAVGYDDTAEKGGVESYASRLGVKGSEDLGGSKVIYQVEYETDIDGDGTVLKQRDSFVGIQYSGLGTVKMGTMDTPLKKAQGKFDLFNDVFDMKAVISGDNRLGNTLNYTTDKMSGLQVSASVIFAEDGTSDGYSASATFSQDALYAAVAYDTKVGSNNSIVRAVGTYNMGDLAFGAIVNQVDGDDVAAADDELAYGVNASMKMGANTAKVQVEAGDQKSTGAQQVSFGVDHKLAKATKAYFYINQYDDDSLADAELQAAFGLEHKF